MQNLNHERHVPDPVQSHNGRRISHPHRIAMDSFSYPDILCFGDGEGFVAKIRSNKKERKWPTNNKTRKERNISYLERHCLNLDYGCPSIVRHDPQCQLENGYGQMELTNGRVKGTTKKSQRHGTYG